MNPLFRRNKRYLVLFVMPAILIFTIVMVYPLLQGFYMSFTEWDGLNKPVFIGLENYKKLFASSDLSMSLKNGIIYSGILVLYQMTLATLLAFVLANSKIKGKKILKNCIFLPVILSVTVVAQLWISIYHGDFGLINQVAKIMGFSWSQSWLTEPIKGVVCIAIADAWKGMGYHMLIIYAAMRNVPEVYYEAARIDGASSREQFFRITIPLITQTLKVSFIMCLTYGFKAFDMIQIMTAGGPGNYSYTMPIMMYKSIFGMQKYGYSNAIGIFIIVICVGIMLILDKIFEKTVVEY